MKLDTIVIGERVRKDMGDLSSLAASMKAHGLLHPVVVKKDHTLVAGHRRLEAARRLGWQDIPVTVVDVEDLLSAERDENEERKDFTPTEAVAIGKLIEEQHKAKIVAQKSASARKGALVREERAGRIDVSKRPVDLPEPLGRTRSVAARAVGMGETPYEQAKEIVAAAEADPAGFGDLPTQMDETGNVRGTHRELERRKGRINGKKISLRQAGKNPERIQEQHMRAEIWQQVRDALINLTSLPNASEVVAIVRAHARDKTLVDKKLKPALNWLREFSDGWCKGNGD